MQISRLGTLRAAIEADTGGLHTSISGAKADFKSFGQKVPGYVKPVSLALIGLGSAVGIALGKIIVDASEYGDQMDKMSKRTGIPVEKLGELEYAANLTGSSIQAIEKGARFLASAMDDTAKGTGASKDAFEKLGISVTDAEGKLKPVTTVMLDVAEKIGGVETATEQVTLATDLFGSRMGTELLPMLKEGRTGIEKMSERAHELGLIMSTEAAAKSAEFRDRLAELKGTAKMAAFDLAETLMPAVTDLTEKAGLLVGKFRALDEDTRNVIGWGTAGAGALAGITGAAGLILTQIPKMAKGWALLRASSVPHIAAIGGAILAVLWAGNETYKAIKNWRDGTTASEQLMDSVIKTAARQVEASEMLREKLYELKNAGIDPMNVSVGLLGVDMDKLNKLLGTNIQETANAAELTNRLAGIIKKAQERIKKFDKDQVEATESTVDFGEAVAVSSEKIGETEKAVVSFSEAQGKSFARAAFLETDQTQKRAHEIGRREILDDEYLDKIRRNHIRRLASAEDTLDKESGLIKGHFDWEIQATYDRSQKAIQIRKDQYAEELQARESLERSIEHIEERAFLMGLEDDERELEYKNLSYRMAVEAEEKSVRDRSKLLSTFLESATANVKAELDLQTTSSQEAVSLIQRVYDDYAPFVEKFNLDAVALEQWRAEQIKAIDKGLSKARIKELDDYYQSYEEHVNEASKFWGADVGLAIPLSKSIYSGMDPAYRKRLNEGMTLTTLAAEENAKALSEMENAESDLAKSSAFLSDELAGHSLTTAFGDVEESMHGFSMGILENIDSITGFTDLAETSARDIVEAEVDKTLKIQKIFDDYLSGKIESADQTYDLMLNAEDEYQSKVRDRLAKHSDELIRIEERRARAYRLLWKMEDVGLMPEREERIEIQEIMGAKRLEYKEPETLETFAGILATEAGYAKGGYGPTIQIMIENMYGGNEAVLNDFAEDIGRRIREQNIQL